MVTPAQLSTLWLPLLVLALLLAGSAWWWWQHLQALAELRTSVRASARSSTQGSTQNPTLISTGITTDITTDITSEAPHHTGVSIPEGSASGALQGATVLGIAASTNKHQPQAALVLGSVERKAYRLLREAFPRAEVLAHVQLLRFIRLPPREQREGWMQGTGMLDADLLLCDGRFRVLAAVDVRTRRDSASSHERNERMARVLQAAGISVQVWHEDALPSVASIRSTITPALVARKAQARAAEASLLQASEAASTPVAMQPAAGAPLVLSTLERAALVNRAGSP